MLPSEALKAATARVMNTMEPTNQDISAQTRSALSNQQPIPKLAGRQGTFKDVTLERIIRIHDRIISGEQITNDEAGFLVLVCFNAANEVSKLQLNCDRLASEFYKQTLNKISLAGRQ